MISTIKFEHGAKTCASEPGVFCKWQGTMGFGMRNVCMLFDQAFLLAKDGWLQRCEQCIEEFGEAE